MQKSSPAARTLKKLSPDKAPRAQENKTQDIYSENVRLINSAWKSEKIIEPEGGKIEGCRDGGGMEDTPAPSNTTKDNNDPEAFPEQKDDLTEVEVHSSRKNPVHRIK